MTHSSRPLPPDPVTPIQPIGRAPVGGPSGIWYFVVTVLTVGFLAAVPFWHAWTRLRRPALRKLAVIYTAADVFLFFLMAITPSPEPDGSSSSSAISTLGAFTMLAVVIAACIQLRGIRREVYATPRHVPTLADPAVARALAGRQRRDEARKLWASDPMLARELGVGRPDLGRGFDDGGLVDLNSAPTAVIAQICGLDLELAQSIVAARQARGGTYFNLGELYVDVSLPPRVQETLNDRALT